MRKTKKTKLQRLRQFFKTDKKAYTNKKVNAANLFSIDFFISVYGYP